MNEAFKRVRKKEDEALKNFSETEYKFEDSDLIGNNSKAGQHTCFPVSTCKPTKVCIKNCYTLNGPITWTNSINKQAKSFIYLVKRVLAGGALEVAQTLDKKTKTFLRWFGKGDLFPEALEVINEQEKPVHVFSKKPELLKKVKPKNSDSSVLQSWDVSNLNTKKIEGIRHAFTIRPEDINNKPKNLSEYDVIFIDHSPSKKKHFKMVFDSLSKDEKRKLCIGIFPKKHEGACNKCFKAKVGCFHEGNKKRGGYQK